MNKDILLAIALTISIAAFIVALGSNPAVQLGGTTHFSGPVDSEAGFTESGTTVIDTDRSITGVDLTLSGEANLDSLIYGGDITQLTATSAAQTLTAAQVCNSSIIRWDSSGTTSTATMPTAATLIADCIPDTGDTKSVLFENYGGETITLVTGTGVEFLEASGGDVVIETTEWALITFKTRGTTTTVAIVESLQVAD